MLGSWGVSFGDPGPYKPQFEGARSYFDQLVSFSRIVMASYVPDLIVPYLWNLVSMWPFCPGLGLSTVLGLGDYLHVICMIQHYGSLADG